MEKVKKVVENIIINYENGDRETVDNNFILNIGIDDNSIQAISNCDGTTILSTILSNIEMLGDTTLISEGTAEKLREVLMTGIKERINEL